MMQPGRLRLRAAHTRLPHPQCRAAASAAHLRTGQSRLTIWEPCSGRTAPQREPCTQFWAPRDLSPGKRGCSCLRMKGTTQAEPQEWRGAREGREEGPAAGRAQRARARQPGTQNTSRAPPGAFEGLQGGRTPALHSAVQATRTGADGGGWVSSLSPRLHQAPPPAAGTEHNCWQAEGLSVNGTQRQKGGLWYSECF